MLRLVVNLNRSPERWKAIKTQLDRLQIPVERLEAVDGKLLPDEVVGNLTSSVHFSMGRELERGEIGCFLSHRKCWERLLDTNEKYALVLEDDLILSDRSPTFMLSDDWIPDTCDLIQLFISPNRKKYVCCHKERDLVTGDQLWIPVSPTPVGTLAYIISRKAAKVALKESETFNLPVDEFLFVRSSVAEQFPCYRLNHTVVRLADIPSEINRSKRRSKTTAFLEIQRFVDRVKRSVAKKLRLMTGEYVEREFDFK